MTRPASIHSENCLLASLAVQDFELLEPNLKIAALAPRLVVYEPGAPITKVYFPHGGAISLATVMRGGQTIEAAMIGREGVLGACAALSGSAASHRAIVQITCAASAINLEPLRQAANGSETIRSLLFQHEQMVFAQAQQYAACNASHRIEARLCRWLCGRATPADQRRF